MNFQDIKETTRLSLAPILSERHAFLVDIHVRIERKSLLIQVFADTDAGITIQECAEISRELRPLLETAVTLPPAGLTLEVSSPGMERPLKYLRQYPRNIGRTFTVRYARDAGQETLKGTLLAVEGETLTFQPERGEPVSLSFESIVESKEELPW